MKKASNRIQNDGMAAWFVLVLILLLPGLSGCGVDDKNTSGGDSEKVVSKKSSTDDPAIVDGIHVATGLKEGEGLYQVIGHCTGCHSARIIIQNRMSADRWEHTIRWMQRTQNLWDLGPNEEIIIRYLATNYAPERKGRRPVLTDIEWYQLDENQK